MLRIAITRPEVIDDEAAQIVLRLDRFDLIHIRKPGVPREVIASLLDALPPSCYDRLVLHDHYELAREYHLRGIHLNHRNAIPNWVLTASGKDRPLWQPEVFLSASCRGRPLWRPEVFLSASCRGRPLWRPEVFLSASYRGRPLWRPIGGTPNEFSISFSCHSLEEVAQYKNRCDYVFLSPIYDSISKQGYHSAFTRDDLLRARDKGIIDEKVIALGGVSEEKIPEIQRLGFGGYAMLGAVWAS
ncbi:MAG: thiamine phosphate synthase [Prevotellaceae bacterium]|nr:thiamine phosphate synthase [Prevotellaceae bacterium]